MAWLEDSFLDASVKLADLGDAASDKTAALWDGVQR